MLGKAGGFRLPYLVVLQEFLRQLAQPADAVTSWVRYPIEALLQFSPALLFCFLSYGFGLSFRRFLDLSASEDKLVIPDLRVDQLAAPILILGTKHAHGYTAFFLPLPLGRPPSLPHCCIRRTNSSSPQAFFRARTLRLASARAAFDVALALVMLFIIT
jgi:hypothetical protein